MACGPTDLLDLEQHGIPVAIDEELSNALDVATFLAFAPEAPATSAVIHGLPGAQGFFPRFAVHMGDHQDLAGTGVLRDGRNEIVGTTELGRIGTVVRQGTCSLMSVENVVGGLVHRSA